MPLTQGESESRAQGFVTVHRARYGREQCSMEHRGYVGCTQGVYRVVYAGYTGWYIPRVHREVHTHHGT